MDETVITTVLFGVTEQQISANERLASLLRLWNEKRGDRLVPRRQDLTAEALRSWLGHVTLVAPVDATPPDQEAGDFVFRLHGSEMAAEIHRDLTNTRLLAMPGAFGRVMLPIYNRTLRSRRPTLLMYNPPRSFTPIARINLLLPLTSGDASTDVDFPVDRLLIAGYPVLQEQRPVSEPQNYITAVSAKFGFD